MSQSSSDSTVGLELDDIQYGAVHQRPSPYVATYLLVRIDDRRAGRELLRRLRPLVDAARPSLDAARDTSVTVAFTYQGLRALGVTPASLDSFAPEFRQGMAARAAELGDVGESSPAAWESPLGSPDVHVAVAVLSPDAARLSGVPGQGPPHLSGASGSRSDLASGLLPAPHRSHLVRFQGRDRTTGHRRQWHAWHQSAWSRPSRPASSSSATRTRPEPSRRSRRRRYSAGTGPTSPFGSSTRGWRPTVNTCGPMPRAGKKRALLGAKMVGRWQSGAPLALCPDRDDPELGSDPKRNNRFLYADDPGGFRCPAGAHARRANPRDSLDGDGSVNVRLHRMIRRGTSYGPPLPEGVLEDDGADRGIVFVFAGTHLDRQFEFVKTQWLNDGVFIGAPEERDPLVGSAGGSGQFTIPQRPIRRRLQGVPPFVVTRGGEYCFVPGLRALDWLAGLET